MKSDPVFNYDSLLFAMQQKNLVYNYNFLYYSNTVVNTAVIYGHPDGWVYQDPGSNGMVGFNSQFNCCSISKSSGNSVMSLTQTINEFPRWSDLLLGKAVSACAVITVPGNAGCSVTFSLSDGENTNSRTIAFNGGDQNEIFVSLDVSRVATTLIISIECSTSEAVLNISKVYANLGSIAIEYLPCVVEGIIGERKQYVSTQIPPATELSLCASSIELSSSYTRLNSVINGRFGTGNTGNSLLPDMRGYFSRAWDNGAGTDPDAAYRTALGGDVTGDQVGTVEKDQFQQHTHQLQFDLSGQVSAGTSSPVPVINKTTASQTGQTGGAETRGKNITELYTIKWA